MSEHLVNFVYLIAAVLIAVGLKGLAHPRTAVRGNMLGAVGMLLAVLVTLTAQGLSFGFILAGLIVGSAIGVLLATKVEMTEMPELVALFNGSGGIASVFVAGAALLAGVGSVDPGLMNATMIATALSALIGSVTFSGSLLAAGKLSGKYDVTKKLPGHNAILIGLLVVAAVISAILVGTGTGFSGFIVYAVLCVVALALGYLLVLPIGGADMPVVVALLNSYSGLAAAMTGFVLLNNILIIAGALVGASGLILTQIMCKAMNRSLLNVMMGMGQAAEGQAQDQDEVYTGKIKATSAEEVAMILEGAQRVVIIPGYGLAVAQAQHAVRDLATELERRGTSVEYGIHPVAGRMPGHMNVLLAESDVPYEQLIEMDEINPTFPQTDVAIVIGANDVVNPVANTDPNSPIAGMPVLTVWDARTTIVIKRSLSPGYAKIPNPLFADDKTLMFFSDAKVALKEMLAALKEA